MCYIISFTYNENEYYCIWVSNDDDYVLAVANKLITFYCIEDLVKYAKLKNLNLIGNTVTKYDIDEMILWSNNVTSIYIDCDKLLNFWNICTDVANGMNEHFIGIEESYNLLYDKLFYGNNLTNTTSQKYVPRFSKEELEELKCVIKNGIQIIIKNFI